MDRASCYKIFVTVHAILSVHRTCSAFSSDTPSALNLSTIPAHTSTETFTHNYSSSTYDSAVTTAVGSLPPNQPSGAGGVYEIKDEHDITCLKAEFEALFTFPSSNNVETKHMVVIPENATYSGYCNRNFTSGLTIHWGHYTLFIHFQLVHAPGDDLVTSWNVHHIELNDTKEVSSTAHDADLFPTSVDKSYVCVSGRVLLLKTPLNKTVSMEIRNLHLQPTQMKTGQYKEGIHCPGDLSNPKSSNRIPIMVALSLFGLIVVIVIAYGIHQLVKKHRASKETYQQMH